MSCSLGVIFPKYRSSSMFRMCAASFATTHNTTEIGNSQGHGAELSNNSHFLRRFSLSTAFQFPALGEIFSLCLGGAIFEMPDILLCTASVKKRGTFWNLWIFSNFRPPKIQKALSATTWHGAEAKSRNPLTRPALRGVVTGRWALCDHLPLS